MLEIFPGLIPFMLNFENRLVIFWTRLIGNPHWELGYLTNLVSSYKEFLQLTDLYAVNF